MCDVSVIITIYNGEKWIDDCFTAIIEQTALNTLNIEICVCNDASTDQTKTFLSKWSSKLKSKQIQLKVYENTDGAQKGVGFGKNRAVEMSTGTYLCFQDVDDIMLPDRILHQCEIAKSLPDNTLIGCRFERDPIGSTSRFTRWANSLTPKQLQIQIYNSHGPTVIMPTWFCHRHVFNRVCGFCEDGKGTPEDLIFFYAHLDNGGQIVRADKMLLIYRYHSGATTFSIDEQTIWNLRIKRLEEKVLSNWDRFTIWNAGKQGRKFYNSLQIHNRNKVNAFCDVDGKKIGKFYEWYDEMKRIVSRKVEIVHYQSAKPPFIICVKLDMSKGEFETNLHSLNLEEGIDYVFFN